MDMTLEDYVTYFTDQEFDIPILQTTYSKFKQLFEIHSFDLEVEVIEKHVMQDPFLALKIILQISHLKRTNLTSEIDCMKKAILLLGTKNVLSVVLSSPVILEHKWIDLAVKRAIYASKVSKTLSDRRFDIRPDEIALSTILADLGELMMWTFKPDMAVKVTEKMISRECTRNFQAQIVVFGFRYKDLSIKLARAWNLPSPIIHILERQIANEIRSKLSHVCIDIARHIYGIDGYKEIPKDILIIKDLMPSENYVDIINVLNLQYYLKKEELNYILESLHIKN